MSADYSLLRSPWNWNIFLNVDASVTTEQDKSGKETLRTSAPARFLCLVIPSLLLIPTRLSLSRSRLLDNCFLIFCLCFCALRDSAALDFHLERRTLSRSETYSNAKTRDWLPWLTTVSKIKETNPTSSNFRVWPHQQFGSQSESKLSGFQASRLWQAF